MQEAPAEVPSEHLFTPMKILAYISPPSLLLCFTLSGVLYLSLLVTPVLAPGPFVPLEHPDAPLLTDEHCQPKPDGTNLYSD